MTNSELYNKYLLKIKSFLENDDLEGLDTFFLNMPSNISIIIPIDILDEVTEFITSKDKKHKEKTIQLINDFKNNKKQVEKNFFQKLFNF